MIKKIFIGLVLMTSMAMGCENQLVHNLGEAMISEGIVEVKGDTLYIDEYRMHQTVLEAAMRDNMQVDDMNEIVASALHIYLSNHYPEVQKFRDK